MTKIADSVGLRARYAEPKRRALSKEVAELDVHCSRFISLSPFCVLSSVGRDGLPDVSPRGGEPGFVQVVDAHTLVMPDSSGNNRLDTLGNLADNPAVAVLFLVPGFDETLRVYGSTEVLGPGEFEGVSSGDARPPKTALKIRVNKAFFQCGKAVMRADLWAPDAVVERSVMPSLGQILNDQIGDHTPGETQAEVERLYRESL